MTLRSPRTLSRRRAFPSWVTACWVAGLASGCADDPARREYFQALELEDTGQPLEDQLRHMDQAVRLAPTKALYIESRGNLLFALGRAPEARADYDRAVALADRPYLRFERADALCALGEYDAALADLDRAIAAQPENVQFYPRRGLVRLALGHVAEARADIDHALAASRPGHDERYARAALLLVEGRPAEALPDLDFVITTFSNPSHQALPRTLRLLAHVALGRPELASTDFESWSLAAAERLPDLGPRYWLVPRSCANGFLATQAAALAAGAASVLARLQPEASPSSAPNPPSAPAQRAPPDRATAPPPPPRLSADTGPHVLLLDYLAGGASPIQFSLNPTDLSDPAAAAIEIGREVWVWTERGERAGVVVSLERNDQWKQHRGGLIVNLALRDAGGPVRPGWAVLSSRPFPPQVWAPMQVTASEAKALSARLGHPLERSTWARFRARKSEYLVVGDRLPCPDGGEECGDYDEVKTTVYEGSSAAGWREIDRFVDGGVVPFVDADGDGAPELVGSTGYKSYVLRRLLPKREILFTSHSGV